MYYNLHHNIAPKIEMTSEEDLAKHGRLYPPVALDLEKVLACSVINGERYKVGDSPKHAFDALRYTGLDAVTGKQQNYLQKFTPS